MNLLKLHEFQLLVRIMNIFTVYGLPEVLKENEFEKNYWNMQ